MSDISKLRAISSLLLVSVCPCLKLHGVFIQARLCGLRDLLIQSCIGGSKPPGHDEEGRGDCRRLWEDIVLGRGCYVYDGIRCWREE